MKQIDDATFADLKNILVWAALWDHERNSDRNRDIYDRVLNALGILPSTPGQVDS